MLRKKQNKESPNITFLDLHPPQEDIRAEVLCGLKQTPKALSPKWFYDETGSHLFNRITRLEEYYLSRVEKSIFQERLPELSALLTVPCLLLEFGCGSSDKVKLLLNTLTDVREYVAVDLSRKHLLDLGESIAVSYPQVEVTAVCGDFTDPTSLPVEKFSSEKKIAFFPGSSIGNFDPPDAEKFLRDIADSLGGHAGLILGVDLKKNPLVLHRAYNDRAGVTARFNLNLLRRINRECAANFDLDSFEHRAFYNSDLGRVEMHLISRKAQKVSIGNAEISFAAGEGIHTENSYKYHPVEIQNLAEAAGWTLNRFWTDSQRYFGLFYFETPR